MFASFRGISIKGWFKLARWTVFGTLGCIAISVAYNAIAFRDFSGDVFRHSLLSATIIPIILAGPLFFYLTLKLRELAIANHRLEVLASTDSLTGMLNRGAFSTRVGAMLEREPAGRIATSGAFLVIDADHFKAINDLYGHDRGDEALRLIAAAIRGSIRGGDVVGRIGGEEFGVLLPGATYANAAVVAERIRAVVEQTEFAPGGRIHRLSVSVGGAAFDRGTSFADLFRLADERLYVAKHAGRNRVSLAAAASAAAQPASHAIH